MKFHLEQMKNNDKFDGKNSGFLDSGFVKTCDELVIEPRGQECVQRLETVGIVLRGRR